MTVWKESFRVAQSISQLLSSNPIFSQPTAGDAWLG